MFTVRSLAGRTFPTDISDGIVWQVTPSVDVRYRRERSVDYAIELKTIQYRHVSWVVNPPVYEWDLPDISYRYEYVLFVTFDKPFTPREWNALREADTYRWTTKFRHRALSRLVGSAQRVDDKTVRMGFGSVQDRDWCEARIHAELAKLSPQ